MTLEEIEKLFLEVEAKYDWAFIVDPPVPKKNSWMADIVHSLGVPYQGELPEHVIEPESLSERIPLYDFTEGNRGRELLEGEMLSLVQLWALPMMNINVMIFAHDA